MATFLDSQLVTAKVTRSTHGFRLTINMFVVSGYLGSPVGDVPETFGSRFSANGPGRGCEVISY